MNHLVYLCYGDGPWIAEIEYSVVSAGRWIPEEQLRRMTIVVTDVPARFGHMPVTIEPIDAETMRAWAGPRNFNHRRKIPALRHALAKYGGGAVLLDGDTYFTRSPAELLERVGERGRSVMHMFEGRIGTLDGVMHQRLANVLAKGPLRNQNGRGGELSIAPGVEMWNAGVVGMHSADIGLLDDVLDLADTVYEQVDIHTAEQFAFSYLLGQHTRRSPVDDVVFHYWIPYLHEAFRPRVAALLERYRTLPLADRAEALHAHRPRPRGRRLVRRWMRLLRQHIGRLPGAMYSQG